MKETIASISTALGTGAISIIRISGEDAIKIANIIFSENLLSKDSHTITYGYIKEDSKIIDEVLLTVMKSPKTYTTEDIVEINCHGGISTTNKVLELILSNGARLAEPGEFTKRAFLNGRIDLGQAEGVMDLIEAKTEKARELAINRLKGRVSDLINKLRKEIIEILANIEVNIDFPEYEDAIEVTNELIKSKIAEFENSINKILIESENNKIIKEGIKTVIIGKPNVGKSSLLNLLINEEKAIVTEIPGTTRDIVEGNIIVEGILLNIIDTAGIRDTSDMIESLGVSKSIKLIDEADLIIVVFDNNNQLSKEDQQILSKTKNKNRIILINKNDLPEKINKKELEEYIEISVKNNTGIEIFKNKIKTLFNIGELNKNDFTYVANARETALLKETLQIAKDIKEGLETNQPIDMLEIDIKRMWEILGEITGETYSDELIDELFTNFCLGK